MYCDKCAALESELATEKAAREAAEKSLAEYAGWSPHQFLGLLEQYRELGKKLVIVDKNRFDAEVRERAAEQRIEALRAALYKIRGDANAYKGLPASSHLQEITGVKWVSDNALAADDAAASVKAVTAAPEAQAWRR